MQPLWAQFEALIPPVIDAHPLGCHRPRVPDRVVFGKLVQVLVLGRHRPRVPDEWIQAGIFERLEQLCLEVYDRIVGIDFADLSVDGCIVKAPCGGESAGRSPVDRGKSGTKRSVLVDGKGIPLGIAAAAANRHDSPLLRPTPERLARFGFRLPPAITVHLDAGYDSKKTRDLLSELGCAAEVATKGKPAPLQAGTRWVLERTNSWHTRGFKKLAICTERRVTVINALTSLANAIITIRRLIREA